MEFVNDFVRPSDSRKVKGKSGRKKKNGRRDMSIPKLKPKLFNPDKVRETHTFFCCCCCCGTANIAILVPLLFLFHCFYDYNKMTIDQL